MQEPAQRRERWRGATLALIRALLGAVSIIALGSFAYLTATRVPYVGELGNGGPAKAPGAMQSFRDAQKAGTEKIDHARFVETTGFARPAEWSPNTGHGHHWFGNAESYFLVGNGLAQAMKDLLGR